jgi:hypothetical protein
MTALGQQQGKSRIVLPGWAVGCMGTRDDQGVGGKRRAQ